jgi:hypothetical protein
MIRCTECGYKNSPVYHYCGVCGAVLQQAPKEEKEEPVPAAAVPATPAPPPSRAAAQQTPVRIQEAPPFFPPLPEKPAMRDSEVGGMSFLGLGSENSSSTPDYLYEDVEQTHWGRYILILILIAGGAWLSWQYWKGEFPFPPKASNPTPQVAESTPPSTETSQANPSAAQPSVEPIPTNPEPSKAPDAAASAPVTNPPAAPTTEAKTETPPEAKTPEPLAPEDTRSVPETGAPVEKAEKAAPKPTKPAPPPEPVVSPGEALYVQGQKYLYGTGVPENCDLALKSLLSAASRAHPRAQSTLGTMYFTGHCVTRDLPNAYRWFAKALRQDPSNIRLEQNLNVVWQQMTPGERQMATR